MTFYNVVFTIQSGSVVSPAPYYVADLPDFR